ncbi:peptide chain release factor N(5)-glutamine methyltransferase [Cellulomonas marina]|uniref:Release factor glutamine methyltransferase n=1 Tax=Cellulomonas marina TaxID=988821 RepID=A0A1I1ASU5_9CELL|nr:peptide chain release factor N(5)-glutamine methyltransferase [Cellulomonas marina]SFB41101.1 release factor glutamine methyltransferase [Cellulomonas marina]
MRAAVQGAARLLAEAGVPSPRPDAAALAAHVLGVDHVLLAPDEAPPGFAARYAGLVERRARREPLQHLVGRTGFRRVVLLVEPGVFVPRPETETVAEPAVAEARRVAASGRPPLVVDLCCGAGPLAVSLAVEVPGARVVAVDASPAAVDLTARNAAAQGVTVEALVGDVRERALLAELDGMVDVLVSNPPYIPPDAEPVDPEVRDHDPALALWGGGMDGLDVPRAVLAAGARLLAPGGLLVVEHAEVQDTALRAAAAAEGFMDVATLPDLTGRPRTLVARRPRGARARVTDSAP